MQETSLTAYQEIQNTISQKQRQVYIALKELGEATNMQIAKRLGWSINRVTPRIYELRNQLKLVGYSKTDKCPITGRQAIFWKCIR